MSKEERNKIVPRLRFPEFRDSEGWEEVVLGEFGETISGLSGKAGIDFGTGKPFITYMQVFSNALIDLNQCGRVIIADNEKQNTIKQGDILITTSSETPEEVGFASVLLDNPNEDIFLNSFCFAYRPNSLKLLYPNFSVYLFHSPFYRKAIHILAQGSTRFNISKGAFLKLKIPITKQEKEQQKIADCLSSLDDLITAQTQKLEALKAHKKGLMQQLFPAEGETVPKLRFADFRSGREWEDIFLENLSTKISDGIHSTPIYDDEGDYYFINGNNLFNGEIYIDEKTKRVSQDEFQKHKKDLNENSILLSINGTIGNFAVYNDEKVILGKSACYINVDELKANKVYIIYYLQTEKNTKYFDTELTGSTIKNLSLKTIKNTVINLPTPEEQQKIADCLSSLDEIITAQAEKIEALKAHKKGLMQQLFPAVQESIHTTTP